MRSFGVLPRRSPIRRSTALLLAAVFVLGMGIEAFDVTDCPHHELGSGAEHTTHTGRMADASATTGMGDVPAEQEHRACTCVGDCGATSPLAPVTAINEVFAGRENVGDVPRPAERLPVKQHHLLPFANAPPTAL